ncbi:patatin-like phospholipase family protein [Aureivirga sp. CE67]|uniref:patatin-like phospholipase family protein n=1 Tax=Aureivirga sp. CE67 TaxID=1788983 RepID=UPI0018C956E2|nr:patatin-like phospholipase family protein [Aureivirga sp. CE67]
MNRLLVVLFCLIVNLSFSQQKLDTIKKKRPKIGLVLSGGGAKGFAHVGALKVIEEAGVEIDYIGGTSMGAIVGSLYASGYSAKEIDSLIRILDFDKILQDKLPRKTYSLYDKENTEKYSFTFPISKGKVGLPKAISKGQNVLNLLTRLTQHVDTIRDFSKLPIPFVCVATDLETGEEVVLRKGFLPEAVRASSSFPTLLEPVELNGRLLIDGGVVNNFPVNRVREMGADIIIGIDVQNELAKKDELDSAVKILNQIVSFQIYAEDQQKVDDVNLYMHPDIDDYSVVSFDKLSEIINEGEITARKYIPQLEELAKIQASVKREKIDIYHPEQFLVKEININFTPHYTRDYILGKLKIKEHQIITMDHLIQGINNLTATNNFDTIQYEILDKDGEITINFNLKESQIATYLQLAGHYDNLFKTGILVNVTSKHLLVDNDVFSLDVVVGDYLRYDMHYFIDNGYNWSYGLNSFYKGFKANLAYSENIENKSEVNYQRFETQVFLQRSFEKIAAIGAGFEHQNNRIFSEVVDLQGNSKKSFYDNSDYVNFISYFKIDSYDHRNFPKSGFFTDVNFRWYLLSSDYEKNFNSFSQIRGKIGTAFTFFDKLTFKPTVDLGFTIGTSDIKELNFQLGGYGGNYLDNFIPLFGYDIGDLNDNSYYKGELEVRYEVLKKNFISVYTNVAKVDNDLIGDSQAFKDLELGYALGYGLETFLGPVQVHYAWSPNTKKREWYFNVGFWF